MQQQGSFCDFPGGDSWVILSPIEQSIKRKIEAVGTPLKDWDINIYRGVLTGYNEAFIISTEKRDEILSRCKTEDERKRTEELIRPILRGRDIKRYGYEWANLYLIATFPALHYDIEQYPAVKQYLLSFAYDYLMANGNEWVANSHLAEFCQQKLAQTGQYVVINGKHVLDDKGNKEKGRKKTSNKWFETQDSISYWDDFNKPKIVYAELARTGNAFTIDTNKMLVGNTGYIITFDSEVSEERLYCLTGFLNSKAILFYLDNSCSKFDENGWRWLRQFVENIPIPQKTDHQLYSEVTKAIEEQCNNDCLQRINSIVYEILGLTLDEIAYLENKYANY